ncbi:MAG: YihY/virulence factor BrkB family protein [Oleiphilaceae bacterium]|nr:YihY/virulence factor BrkB family protein [Oleiphilaceae bacterium]
MNTRVQEWRQRLFEWLLQEPHQYSGLAEKIIRRAARILFAVIRDLINGQLTLHAMSLVYTTMLSVVPLLALSFSVLKAFNVQDKFTPMLYSFFEPMGEKGLEIHNNVLSFVENMKVGVLGAVGFVLLFYTVVSLVQKIERAFNTIWYAPELRSLSQRFSNYLSVILVGPALVVSALSVTASTMNSQLVKNLIAIEPFGSVIFAVSKIMPFLMIIGAFTFFYVLMPNTRVNLKSALMGGVVSGACWQGTSMLFTSFVVNSAKYDAIYSGFAVGILLLIWLYLNWLILLIGSSIAFYHQHGNHITRTIDVKASPDLLEKVWLYIMVQVAHRYESGQRPLSQEEVEQLNFIPAIMTRGIVDKLIRHGLLIVAGDKSEALAPGRSTDHIKVMDILDALRADDCHLLHRVGAVTAVENLVNDLKQHREQMLAGKTLRDLLPE